MGKWGKDKDGSKKRVSKSFWVDRNFWRVKGKLDCVHVAQKCG